MKPLQVGILVAVMALFHGLAQATSYPHLLLTPRNIAEQPHEFSIIASYDEKVDATRFIVKIKSKDKKQPPEIGSGYLEVRDGDHLVAGCRLQVHKQDEEALFEFVVSPKLLEKSQFHFTVWAVEPEQRKNLPAGSGLPGYSFYLKDFVFEKKK